MASVQYATFEVADQLFGVTVDAVQEVLSFNEYTAVPLAPAAVGGLFNLRVDRIGEVIDLDESTFEPPPDTLAGPARELVIGTFKLQDRLMLALDPNHAVDTYRG